jgi:hypothetical protein
MSGRKPSKWFAMSGGDPSKWFAKGGDKRPTRKRVTEKRKPAGPSSKPKRAILLASISIIVTLLGVGAYWFVWPMLQSQGPEPAVAALVLEKLRKMPSNQEGLTVEESIARELEKSRRVGNLVSYQGWSVRLAPNDKSKLLVIFSFDERDNTKQSAEWLADPVSSTFTPQTDLAAAVFKK